MSTFTFAVSLLALSFLLCEAGNPCCSDPCQNRGVCTPTAKGSYECDCTRTGYTGPNCTTPEFLTWVKVSLKPSPNTVHYLLTHFKGFWNIINNISFLRDAIMRYVLTSRSHLIDSPPTFNADYDYKSWEAYSNLSYYTRTLPPVSKDCPTPMGVAGKKELPDSKLLAEKVLMRRQFIPDPQRTNLMFAFFAQHFTHQFFKSDMKKGPAFTVAKGHGVDLSHIYGDNLERQHKLRLFKDGKLKYQILNGEVYPPTVKDVGADMHYPPNIPESERLAVGHEAFGLVPGLMMYATIWLREHNRVCDVLKEVHPDWDDERLFQTTRLILIGETIKIVIEDYVQHLSGYHFKLKFDPELLFKERFQYQNRIASEFNTLYHWHPLMPDSFHIEEKDYSYKEFVFNNSVVTRHGISHLVDSFTKQLAGRVAGGRNVPKSLLYVAIKSIENSREMRYQSLNAYRKRFSMKPYSSFEEMTGEKEMAAELEEMYGHVDAVELYTGLLVEKPRTNAIFGETLVEMGAPYSLKGLMGNPICSPEYWKPSTFGGKVGFDIVNTATLQMLVCNNVRGPCPVASFHVPDVKDTGSVVINSSTSHGSESNINPTVIFKERTTEL
ncbi:prostaglandin G/H synthase 2 [Takifugu rubripes]|uniref:prostaglandin G/H synthase 2 n=1 Tax=Takifugu rubripes TaxID=31033 RepID=UPI0000660546|nr:prostaglandin G/H synthase 2 [Takifugu rubripes]|eukprot:XP_003978482.1 PREDICTED: prostaglandin G/H synthase 2 isoform X2 [Takifugu rubripes]